jgi:beta-glucanase (GH16 family)
MRPATAQDGGMWWRRTFAVALCLAAVVPWTISACASSPPAAQLEWSDEFDGLSGSRVDPASWNAVTGGDGWGNAELECYIDSPSTASLDGDGDLVITAYRAPGHRCSDGRVRDVLSARLTTEGKRSFTYGRLEMRAKLPTGQGIWPAFWALGVDHATVGWPRSGEIDVTEVIGRSPRTTFGSLHGPTGAGAPYVVTRQVTLPTDLSTAFHIYAINWTDGGVDWTVDGVSFAHIDRATVTDSGRWVFDHPFYLLLDLAVGGRWPGPPDATTVWPQRMVIDYVRVYGAS